MGTRRRFNPFLSLDNGATEVIESRGYLAMLVIDINRPVSCCYLVGYRWWVSVFQEDREMYTCWTNLGAWYTLIGFERWQCLCTIEGIVFL